MDRAKFTEAFKKALEGKGKRKFTQSVELIVNTRSDFTKAENRVKVDVHLPKGKGGKELKSAVFAEGPMADAAKKAGADLVITPAQMEEYADKVKVNDLAKNYFLLAQPNLMGQVAKSMGQVLGKKGKLPSPITGKIDDMLVRGKNTVRVVSKGKFLPTLQAFIGTEKMEAEELAENAEAVFDAIKAKVSESNVKSVYVKLTMGKPIRVA